MGSHSTKGNRFQISFKENVRELNLMNFMLSEAELIGISTYIKSLIDKDYELKKDKK